MSDLHSDLPSHKRIFCNTCRTATNHTVQSDHTRDYVEETEDGQYVFMEEVVARFRICAGCERATLEESWTASGNVDRQGEQIYSSTYFPTRSEFHVAEKHFRQLPNKLNTIYLEAIQAVCRWITRSDWRYLP